MTTELDAAATAAGRADTTDWDEVYRVLLPRVYRYFCYRVGEGQLAEDLASTTFEKVWRRRKRYRRNLSAFSTWIFTIARNVAIDHFRTTKATLSIETISLPDDGSSSPEAMLMTGEDVKRLSALLARLPDTNRELLALRYGADLSYAEIAEVSGLSPSNVGVILHRTVKRLREMWEGTDGR